MREVLFAFLITVALGLLAADARAADHPLWEPLTIDVEGPAMSESGDPNPFRDVRMTVTFTNGEAERIVPGYFAADGDAAESGAEEGNVWRVHFTPDRTGEWSWRVSLRAGQDIVLSDELHAGEPVRGDGETGTFTVVENPHADGMLQYVGERYLRWSGSGRYFLKSGVDSPENLLAYVDFDDTEQLAGGNRRRRGEAAQQGLHHYRPHVRDWREGDPFWGDGRGKGLIGAINYLAAQGVNSMYFIPMNIGGDGKDVWPYTAPDVRDRFDCSRLAQWEIVFSHMDASGIMLHMILTETENESLFEIEEGGDFADTRKLYYRELIARFAHHRAIEWNLGEENGGPDDPSLDEPHRGNTDAQRKTFARFIRDLDPYDHPIVVHTYPGDNWYQKVYSPLLGSPYFEGPSIQIGIGGDIHGVTKEWLRRSEEAGRPWFVCIDEQGPAGEGIKPDADDPTHDQARTNVLWANLMAGGSGCEWYFGYQFPHNDLNLNDFRSREEMYRQTRIAVDFFQERLPFPEMASADELVTNDACWCLAQPDKMYAIYLPPGERTEVRLPDGDWRVAWFNPREGGPYVAQSTIGVSNGEPAPLGPPPSARGDWVAVIVPLQGT